MPTGFRNFTPEFLEPLFKAFQGAWHDQEPGLSLPFELFKLRLFDKLNISEEISLLSFENERIEGFILHTINQYQGSQCAYNGGTGVIPQAQGKGLTKRMYELLLPKIKALTVEKVILEALKKNSKAIHIYETIGFEIRRGFKCFAKRGYFNAEIVTPIRTAQKFNPDYSDFWDIDPCFLDQPQQLVHNLRNEVVLESIYQDQLAGYIIFQPQIGRISQLAINPPFRGKGIGKMLISKAHEISETTYLTIMNIPEDAGDYISFLEKVGFVNELDQYEMELIL